MHGYQLNDFIESTLATCMQIKRPTAYYVLNKMQEDGWVEDMEEQEGNRPPRRIYSITAAGESAFQELLRQNLASYELVQFTGDVGLAFLGEVSAEEGVMLLQQRRDLIRNNLAQTQAIPLHSDSLQLTIEHQLRHLTAELDWLDEVIARLEMEK